MRRIEAKGTYFAEALQDLWPGDRTENPRRPSDGEEASCRTTEIKEERNLTKEGIHSSKLKHRELTENKRPIEEPAEESHNANTRTIDTNRPQSEEAPSDGESAEEDRRERRGRRGKEKGEFIGQGGGSSTEEKWRQGGTETIDDGEDTKEAATLRDNARYKYAKENLRIRSSENIKNSPRPSSSDRDVMGPSETNAEMRTPGTEQPKERSDEFMSRQPRGRATGHPQEENREQKTQDGNWGATQMIILTEHVQCKEPRHPSAAERSSLHEHTVQQGGWDRKHARNPK